MIRMEKNVFFLIDHPRHFDRVVWNISLKCIQGFLQILLAGVSKRFMHAGRVHGPEHHSAP